MKESLWTIHSNYSISQYRSEDYPGLLTVFFNYMNTCLSLAEVVLHIQKTVWSRAGRRPELMERVEENMCVLQYRTVCKQLNKKKQPMK